MILGDLPVRCFLPPSPLCRIISYKRLFVGQSSKRETAHLAEKLVVKRINVVDCSQAENTGLIGHGRGSVLNSCTRWLQALSIEQE